MDYGGINKITALWRTNHVTVNILFGWPPDTLVPLCWKHQQTPALCRCLLYVLLPFRKSEWCLHKWDSPEVSPLPGMGAVTVIPLIYKSYERVTPCFFVISVVKEFKQQREGLTQINWSWSSNNGMSEMSQPGQRRRIYLKQRSLPLPTSTHTVPPPFQCVNGVSVREMSRWPVGLSVTWENTGG